MLPAKVERVFAVSPSGEVNLIKPEEPKKLTLSQRHASWRIGLMAVDKFMKEHGFTPGGWGDSSTHYSWGKGQFIINVSLRKPGNIAYVTSRAGVDPMAARPVIGKDKTGAEMYGISPLAQVTTLQETLGNAKYVVMVDVCHNEGGTRPPVYIAMPEEGEKPAHFLFKNVLGVMAMMCRSIPSLKEAFEVKKVLEAQQQEIED